MSLTQRRWMLIDDAAEDVSYSGSWFIDTYARPGPSQFVGGATGGTAHGTDTAGGLAFSFEGTRFLIRGQSNLIPAYTDSVLRCTVDGVEASSDVVDVRNLNSWRLCSAEDLGEGLHQVVVNITAGPNTIFWVDEIYYYSLPRPNLRRKASMLYPTTAEFRYAGVSWMNPFDQAGNNGRESYLNGAKVTIPFYGTSVELASYLTSSMPRFPGSGSYSLDGGPPVLFEMPTWTPNFRGLNSNDSIFRHTVFTTPTVSPGHHTLEVVNLGNANTVPLSLDYFLIHHGDVDATTAMAPRPNVNTNTVTNIGVPPINSSTPSGLPSDSSPSQGAQKNNVGVIVGAVVGTLVLLGLGVFLFLGIRKRRRDVGTPEPSSRWVPGDYAALDLRDVPVDETRHSHVAPEPDERSLHLPNYAPSENGSDATFQQTMMYYRTAPKEPILWST